MIPKDDRLLSTEPALVGEVRLAARAAEILRKNDMGAWTKAAPDLYPHQWSWDSAFIAIGLSRFCQPPRRSRGSHPFRAPVEERSFEQPSNSGSDLPLKAITFGRDSRARSGPPLVHIEPSAREQPVKRRAASDTTLPGMLRAPENRVPRHRPGTRFTTGSNNRIACALTATRVVSTLSNNSTSVYST